MLGQVAGMVHNRNAYKVFARRVERKEALGR
jgi:hypothetical protein